MNEKKYIKELKEYYNFEPNPKINVTIQLEEIRHVTSIQTYPGPYKECPCDSLKKDDENIKREICEVIYRNFRKYIWDLALSKKYKAYERVANNIITVPSFFVCSDGKFKTEGSVNSSFYNSSKVKTYIFDEVLDFFNAKITCTKEDFNMYDYPRFEYEIIFDVKKAIKNLKSL